MIKMTLVRNTFVATRQFTTSAFKRSAEEGVQPPGSNLPFRIDNRYRLTAMFVLFFGSGFAIPFIAVRHQMLKK